MSVTVDDIRKISHLAKICVDDGKIDELCNNLNSIIRFVEQLDEVDCSSVDDTPTISDVHEREDVVELCDPAVMENAPQKECNMFVVPKVIG
jgi:aspartyl-tRNA(Asn)/glutamyl-tRNA(Gln) amidotransferase subunit C